MKSETGMNIPIKLIYVFLLMTFCVLAYSKDIQNTSAPALGNFGGIAHILFSIAIYFLVKKIAKKSNYPKCWAWLAVIVWYAVPMSYIWRKFNLFPIPSDAYMIESFQNTSAPALGNLNGVPVSIPAHYQFFSVNYVGENVWAGIKNKEPATLDTPIKSFGIRVRLPDLVPVSSPALFTEWQRITNTSPFYPWVHPGVYAETYNLPPEQWGKAWIGRVSADRTYPGCRYQKTEEHRFGLSVEKLICDNEKSRKLNSQDFMYEEGRWRTVIECDTRPLKNPGGKRVCQQRFPIPEMNAMVSFSFFPEHLSDWKTNQEKITDLLKSFVVENYKYESN